MTTSSRRTLSYVLMGGGVLLLALSVLLLIATYQHNAAVAAELEEARAAVEHSAEAANGTDEEVAERAQALADIDASAAEERGSYVPPAVILLAGAGSLLIGARVYRRGHQDA